MNLRLKYCKEVIGFTDEELEKMYITKGTSRKEKLLLKALIKKYDEMWEMI